MNNRILLMSLAIAAAAFGSASAEYLSPAQALERFAKEAAPIARKAAAANSNLQLRHTFSGEYGDVAYLFTPAQEQGFVVLSADSRTAPLLGYSLTASPNGELPPQMFWLLDEYGRQLEYMRTNDLQADQAPDDGWPAIEPLISTTWDQGAPFFNMAPENDGKHCYTGCVATAMAQVMNFWNYPERGEGTHKYTTTTLKQQLEIDFAEQPFDWDNMLDTYTEGNYSQQQADAVAWLMKACGHAVDMNYTTISSGAPPALISGALVKHFGYDNSAEFRQRLAYSPSEWRTMVYENLHDTGPIIYNGQTQFSGGHSFVCDGYDGNGYFHFNWGWSGMSDGYFMLDILNPDSQGIGGAEGGFNFKQDAVFDIRPATGQSPERKEPQLTQYGSLFAFITGVRTLNFGVENFSPLGWGSSNPDIVRMLIGILIEPIGDTPGEPQVIETEESTIFTPGYFYPYSESFTPKARIPVSLPQGSYRVSLVTQDSSSPDGKWMPMIVPNGYADHATLVKNEEGLSVVNATAPKLSIPEAKVKGEIVHDKPVTVVARITNDSDTELTQGVSIVLLQGENEFRRFVGEGVNVSLAPGESVEKEIVAELYAMAGKYDPLTDIDFTLALHNPITGEYFGKYGAVRMLEYSCIQEVGQTGDIVVSSADGAITISGLNENQRVEIFTPDGKIIASSRGKRQAAFARLTPGIYIVVVADSNSIIFKHRTVL